MKNFNKYDFLIIVTIATLAWGNNEVLRFLYPIRVLGFIGLFITVINWKTVSVVFKKWIPFIVAWAVYIICSVVWTPNIGDGIIQMFHLITVFGAMGMMMVASLKAKHPFNAIVLGWAAMVLITLPIAFWELRSGEHLSSGSHNADSMSYGQLRVFAAVTFGNLNSYAVALASALPFVLTGWIGSKKDTHLRLVLITLSLIMAGIIIMNASRGCMLCLVVGVLLMLMLQSKGRFGIGRIVLVISIGAAALYFAIEKLQLDLFWELSARLENEGMETGRGMIYWAGIMAAMETFFLGGGVGCTVPMMIKAAPQVSVHVTHNVFLEILIEYGLVICLVFIWKFYKTGFALWRSQDVKEKLIGYYVVISSVFLFLVDDYYTGESVFWIYLASIIIISTLYTRRKKSESIRVKQESNSIASYQ